MHALKYLPFYLLVDFPTHALQRVKVVIIDYMYVETNTHISVLFCVYFLLQRKGKKKMTLTISKGGIRIVDDATKVHKKAKFEANYNN